MTYTENLDALQMEVESNIYNLGLDDEPDDWYCDDNEDDEVLSYDFNSFKQEFFEYTYDGYTVKIEDSQGVSVTECNYLNVFFLTIDGKNYIYTPAKIFEFVKGNHYYSYCDVMLTFTDGNGKEYIVEVYQ